MTKNEKYYTFEESVQQVFNEKATDSKLIFKVQLKDLVKIFKDNLDESLKQQYDCNSCKHFINRTGRLVTIDENNEIKSLMWDEDKVAPQFQDAFKALRLAVESSKIAQPYKFETSITGMPSNKATLENGEKTVWTHLHVKVPNNYLGYDSSLFASQSEDFLMMVRALQEFTKETLTKAEELILSETLYRSSQVKSQMIWFKNIVDEYAAINNAKNKQNFLWKAVVKAPSGYTHIRSSVLGTLLSDIQEGLSTRAIKMRFEEKMNPNNYMRSSSAPTSTAIIEAEKVIANLGVEDSLERKYATLEEIPSDVVVWKPSTLETKTVKSSGGIFSNVKSKEQIQSGVSDELMNLPLSTMTWAKFQRTVLNSAKKIQVLMDAPSQLMSLVTAKNPTAKNIMKWDNTFSWYYQGGADSEIRKRVEGQGGRYENNDIRVSLIWNNYTDLDLHATDPNNEHIYYSNKRGRSGGYLDIDMNAGGNDSKEPIENIRFGENGTAKSGHYSFSVNNYSDRNNGDNPYKVELEVGGKVYTIEGHLGYSGTDKVIEFDYHNGNVTNLELNGNEAASLSTWEGVDTNTFADVNLIIPSPNAWNSSNDNFTHIFFLLDGVKDNSEGIGRGFFNEMLMGELRPIRKVLESFTESSPILDADDASACGVGFTQDKDWNLTLKVFTEGSVRLVKIDRWD